VSPASARALRRRRVAELRAAEPELSLRQMADRLGISRDTVTRDLEAIDQEAADNRPPAETPDPAAEAPSAGDAAEGAPVADPAPQVSEGGRSGSPSAGAVSAGQVPQERPPADEPDRVAQAPADEVAEPVADGGAGQRLVIDLSRHPGLAEDLALLETTGATTAEVIDYAVDRLAATVRNARARGLLAEGQRFQVVNIRLRPLPVARGGKG
jgi:hypothetical protein